MINANGYQWRFVNTKQNHTKPTSVGSETFEFLMSSACLRITKGRRFISSLRPLLLFHPQHAFQLVHIVLSELFILHDLSSQVVSDQKKPTPSPQCPLQIADGNACVFRCQTKWNNDQNAASGCWMMLGCWCMLQYVTMLGQAAGSKASLISSKFFLTHSSASGTTPSENLGRIPWYPHL